MFLLDDAVRVGVWELCAGDVGGCGDGVCDPRNEGQQTRHSRITTACARRPLLYLSCRLNVRRLMAGVRCAGLPCRLWVYAPPTRS
jgi:hypothetical protein